MDPSRLLSAARQSSTVAGIPTTQSTDVQAVRLPRFGVIGSVRNDPDGEALQRCWDLGTFIALARCVLLTRACAGLTHAVVLGAKSAGGHVLGISPAASLQEHTEVFAAPWRDYDLLIFTGPDTSAHELIHVRSSDVLVLVGAGAVTFDDLAVACEESKLVGVLGGYARETKPPDDALIIRDDDPERLVARLLWEFVSRLPIARVSDHTLRPAEVQR
jgi:predicted Rossmann-fold nucleotide-binding protein